MMESNQNDFFLAFKNKMTSIMKDMNKLKEKANTQRADAKSDNRLAVLE